ncbi:MAG TPA: hypothetical protein VGD36_14545 [Xanthobacteraceae bacterium]|jgi:hypothetical protein
MSAVESSPVPSFNERAAQLLECLDYRRADTAEDKEAIYRLRYEAYLREQTIVPDHTRRFADADDDLPNVWIFGLYIEGTLASSIRLHVASSLADEMPSTHVFEDVLRPHLAAGRTLVDPTRFVADYNCARNHPELPYLTLRLIWLAGEYFNADLMLAAVRSEHQAFYKRVFGHRPVCEPRVYPQLTKPISLMTLDYRAQKERVHQRYPFLRSTFFERRMLFERGPVQQSAAARHAA